MSSATLSITDDDKIYHLVSECTIRVFCPFPHMNAIKMLQVKPEDNNNEQTGAGGGRQKLIREVFLPRLLATKVG